MGGRAKTAASAARGMTAVSFADAMEMVKDKEKATAFFAKLEGLKAEISQDYDKSLMIDEIDRLLIQIRGDRNMAAEELEGAKKTAEGIVAEARRKAQKASSARDRKSLDREAAVKLREDHVAAAQTKLRADVQTQATATLVLERAAAEIERTSKQRLAEANTMKARYDTALASMKVDVAAA